MKQKWEIILGFLNYEDGNVKEGNFGIWDMVMALQWIQANMKQVDNKYRIDKKLDEWDK